jgi:hypothetical protein
MHRGEARAALGSADAFSMISIDMTGVRLDYNPCVVQFKGYRHVIFRDIKRNDQFAERSARLDENQQDASVALVRALEHG